MRKRYVFASGFVVLAILLTLVVWQVSFNFGEFGPADAAQTFGLWALSTLIFILTVILLVRLIRTAVKLYLERQSGREGSRLKSKLVFGALALSLLPVVFLYAFGYGILNRTLKTWFTRPADRIKIELVGTAVALGDEVQGRAQALANWLSTEPEVTGAAANLSQVCLSNRIAELRVEDSRGVGKMLCQDEGHGRTLFTARAALADGRAVVVRVRPRIEIQEKQDQIQGYVRDYDQIAADKSSVRKLYLLFLLLIALFILFAATWIALVLSRQISVPISALLEAVTGRVRTQGNLSHRVSTHAIDELATLVRAFNEMMQALEANSRELESRRQFTEAILESIPTGVISLTADGGAIRHCEPGLAWPCFQGSRIEAARRLDDLFSRPRDAQEIPYLMKRAAADRRGSQPVRSGIFSGPQPHGHVRPPGRDGLRCRRVRRRRRVSRPRMASCWCSKTPASCCALRKPRPGMRVARRIAHELKNPADPHCAFWPSESRGFWTARTFFQRRRAVFCGNAPPLFPGKWSP